MSIEGIRVVRGSDWSQGDTDGGEGHVGTVSKVNTDHTVVVQWDMGNTTRCRTGKGDKCDLRILDSAPAGVRHNGFACDGSSCKQSIFSGTRWRCSQCSDFDLCSSCYFKDKHNIQHTFFRFDAPGMDGVLQPKRSTRERIRSWGTFEDATVERGPDWEYSDHDGGKGAVGTVVVSVSVPDNHAAERNVVTVRWHKKETIGHYRLGCDGKVDVLCVEAAPGNDYYTEHLMPLNTNRIHPETTLREMQSGTGVDCVAERKFQKGDKVCIQLPKVALKEAQKGHGGWNLHMNNNIGQHGEVKDVEENGDVLATFDGKEWHLSSGAVCKVLHWRHQCTNLIAML